MSFIERSIEYVSPTWALKRQATRNLIQLARYQGADTGRLRGNWISFGEETATPPGHELDLLRKRARDANRNDPIASGATDTLKTNIVGNGLIPQSRIRGEYIGLPYEQASILQKQAELIWQKWKPYADAGDVLDFDEIQFLVLAKIIEDGESIVIPTWANETWRPLARCFEILESERLNTPTVRYAEDIKHGIRFGNRGQPLTYYIRKAAGKDQASNDYAPIQARDRKGRPKIFHLFPTKRPGQIRGIPFFAPVLTYFKDLADYLEAEVVAARVAACLAVFITKTDPMQSAINMATGTETSTSARIQELEPGLVGYLGMGEGINVVDPKRPGDSFQPFVENLLRIIGVSIGLPYELLVKDFSKTNYSSARASLLEGRRMFTQWRGWFARKFCQPVWEMILEEAYLRGEFQAPDFYTYKQEYCRAQWIGGAWGWVDPVKETDAAIKRIGYGISSYADEIAGQGGDWQETLEQRKREQDFISELGVTVQSGTPPPQPEGGNNAEAEEERE